MKLTQTIKATFVLEPNQHSPVVANNGVPLYYLRLIGLPCVIGIMLCCLCYICQIYTYHAPLYGYNNVNSVQYMIKDVVSIYCTTLCTKCDTENVIKTKLLANYSAIIG
jgi:hypothetical protein